MVIEEDEQTYDYDIIVKKIDDGVTKYVLKYSDNENRNWHVRGKKIITIIDNDLNIKVKYHDFDANEMGYGDMISLQILLNFINQNTNIPTKYIYAKKL